MIVTIDGIPVFRAEINGTDTGMFAISLVDEPAVLRDFQKFHKEEMAERESKRLLYSITDEEKHLVRGVVMRSDFPIYRRDGFYEYYIIYKADTIREMAEKYLAENLQNTVDLDHDGIYIKGVQMVQWFIKDTAKGINPEGFEDCAEGSLFAEFHITDPEIWEAVKAGTYKGFSLEGFFDIVPEESEDDVQRIVEETKGLFSKLQKLSKDMKFTNFLNALRKAVAFRTVTSDKGLIAWNEDRDLEVGDELFIEDEEGNRTPAPDDVYTLTDGVKVTTEGGKVTIIDDGEEVEVETPEGVAEIEAPEAEVETEETPAEAPAEEPAPEVENPDNPGEERTPEAIEALRKEMNEAYARIDALEEAINELREANRELRERLEKVEATPAAVEAHKAVKLASAKETKRENLARILEAKRK